MPRPSNSTNTARSEGKKKKRNHNKYLRKFQRNSLFQQNAMLFIMKHRNILIKQICVAMKNISWMKKMIIINRRLFSQWKKILTSTKPHSIRSRTCCFCWWRAVVVADVDASSLAAAATAAAAPATLVTLLALAISSMASSNSSMMGIGDTGYTASNTWQNWVSIFKLVWWITVFKGVCLRASSNPSVM